MDYTYNIYCDESCHMMNDGIPIMVLGGIWCHKHKVREINDRIREIKQRYGINYEMKWTKISSSTAAAYKDLVNYFFDDDDLHFRVLVVDNKDALNHEAFGQTHDEWYYKEYFEMLRTILDPTEHYNIYMDIKDTKSKTKIAKLRDVLSNNMWDFSGRMIQNVQVIRSHEVELMQIVDVLIGAMSYYCRGLNKMDSKNEIIELIKRRSKYQLSKSTLYREQKFNIFHHRLQEGF